MSKIMGLLSCGFWFVLCIEAQGSMIYNKKRKCIAGLQYGKYGRRIPQGLRKTKMKFTKQTALACACACAALLCACAPSGTQPTATPGTTQDTAGLTQSQLRQKGTDYTYFWWDYGIANTKRNAYVQTGNYGFMLDARTAKFKTLGGLSGISRTEAASGTNDAVDALPAVKDMSYGIKYDGKEDVVGSASYVHNDRFPMSGAWQEGAGKTNAVRIISSGTYIQRFDVMQLLYNETEDITARAEFSCVSDYLTLTYDAKNTASRKRDVELSFSLELDEAYSTVAYSDERSVVLRRQDGQSVGFVLPAGNTGSLKFEGSRITATAAVTVGMKDWTGFSLVIIPGKELGENCVKDYYASEQVKIEAENTEPTRSDVTPERNALNSAYEILMPSSAKYTDYSVAENRTAYERTPFTVSNPTDRDTRVTLCFKKRLVYPYANYGLWGMSPMLVDPKTNEPTGIAVQYSRNPHNYTSYNDILYGSCWVNCYVYLDVPAGGSVSYDFVCAFSCWGETYASSIAQMCLVGWGGNQWWLSASIGSSTGYGETFGFDPERGCGRSLIDDTHPLFSRAGGGPGGGDWLALFQNGAYRNITRQKITIKTVGPNVSSMTIGGYFDNKKAYAEMTVTVCRSNDYAKMINSFRYEFLDDVSFNRVALYQLGADNYNGIRFAQVAYGDADGVKEILEVPAEGTKSAYVKQYVEMPGKDVWVAQYGSPDTSCNADKGMAVREYSAEINGKVYSTPTLSFYITNNYCTNLAAELSLPKEIADTGIIEKGSKISGTVEYLVVPRNKSDYTGTSEYIKSLPAEAFSSAEIIRRYAVDGAIEVTAAVGSVEQSYPATVKTENGTAEVTIKGGIGYTPITFRGLDSYSGYRLYKVEDGKETMVDQSVRGNDYWQVYRDPDTGLYDISFNVYQIKESGTYRLKKA